MKPWLALASAGANSCLHANRASWCQKAERSPDGPRPIEPLAPNGSFGTGLPNGTAVRTDLGDLAPDWSAHLLPDPAGVVLRAGLKGIEWEFIW